MALEIKNDTNCAHCGDRFAQGESVDLVTVNGHTDVYHQECGSSAPEDRDEWLVGGIQAALTW